MKIKCQRCTIRPAGKTLWVIHPAPFEFEKENKHLCEHCKNELRAAGTTIWKTECVTNP